MLVILLFGAFFEFGRGDTVLLLEFPVEMDIGLVSAERCDIIYGKICSSQQHFRIGKTAVVEVLNESNTEAFLICTLKSRTAHPYFMGGKIHIPVLERLAVDLVPDS